FTTPSGHQPITFVASSGDRAASNKLQWPGTSPNVVSVGGSTLTLANASGITIEAPWTGSSSGASAYEPAPSYQNSPTRAVPDVPYNAEPSPGFAVFDTTNGGWVPLGGTSAGAPQWAALFALANQIRVSNGLPTLDGQTQSVSAIQLGVNT